MKVSRRRIDKIPRVSRAVPTKVLVLQSTVFGLEEQFKLKTCTTRAFSGCVGTDVVDKFYCLSVPRRKKGRQDIHPEEEIDYRNTCIPCHDYQRRQLKERKQTVNNLEALFHG